jgi:hypoxanthine phosphoribosyltransferase
MDGLSLGAVVLSADDLKKRIAELGEQITRDYAGRDLVLIGVSRARCIF